MCTLYICVYTCVYVYIYVIIFTYIFIFVYIYTYIHVYMYIYVFSNVWMNASFYLSIYDSICIHISHLWVRIQIRTLSSVSFKASWIRTRRVLSFHYEHTSSKIMWVYKNPLVTDGRWLSGKCRSGMLQIGLLLHKFRRVVFLAEACTTRSSLYSGLYRDSLCCRLWLKSFSEGCIKSARDGLSDHG